MAVTQNTYTGDGSTVLFSFTFPYLETTDIKVNLDGSDTTAYTLANATTIQFNTAPANGAAIRIYRETDDSALAATFYPGSAIRSNDLNDNFTQNLYVTQESTNNAATANTTANTALTNSNTAISTANSAVITANTAASNASAAVATANTASSNASAAVSTANTASTNATTAVNTANAATATANSAVSDAATAISTANSAVSTANTASTNATNAVNTANAASSTASSAVSTANTASTNASNAVSTANSAVTTANNAVSTANSAVSTANSAVSTANAAASAVANAILYDIVANVAAIPGSPANNDAVEVTDSTGIESFTPLAGVPSGFVGDSGLSVRIVYTTTGSTWNWIQYFPNDPETRYGDAITTLQSDVTGLDNDKVAKAGDTMTGNLTAPALIPSGSTVPTNGVYLPAANSVALSTNGTGRLFIDSSGRLLVGVSSVSGLQTGARHVFNDGSGAAFTGVSVGNPGGGLNNVDLNITAWSGSGSNFFTSKIRQIGDGSLTFQTQATSSVDGTGTTTERLRITSAGLVGIGTSSPSDALTISRNNCLAIAGTGFTSFGGTDYYHAKLTLQDPSNRTVILRSPETISEAAIGTSTNHVFTFITNNVERARFDTSGRLGIGTTTVGDLLHLRAATTPHLRIDHTTTSSFGAVQFYEDGTQQASIGALGSTSGGTGGSNALQIWNFLNAPTVFATNNTERARIDSSGRLLVGTSSAPTGTGSQYGRFVVSGNTLDNTTNARLSLRYGSTPASLATGGTVGDIFFTDASGNDYASILAARDTSGTSTGRLVLSTTADGASSPTERMRIDSGGMFYFRSGGVTPSSSTPGSSYGYAGGYHWVNAVATTGLEYHWAFVNPNGEVGKITTSSTSTSFATTSDYRLKENVIPVTDGVARLQQLKPSRFNFIAEPSIVVDGFLAHEVQAVVPEAIVGEKDEVDADGNPVYQAIDQSKLVPLLTAALQEAIGEIESLKARVAALESA